ncbi:MAG: BhlA/UviB family holin-like peptide [Christensenellales bacterium]
MWEKLIETAATNGVWAALCVWLLFYLMNDSRKREEKYQRVIDRLTSRLEEMRDIRKDVGEIRDAVWAKSKEKSLKASARKTEYRVGKELGAEK